MWGNNDDAWDNYQDNLEYKYKTWEEEERQREIMGSWDEDSPEELEEGEEE